MAEKYKSCVQNPMQDIQGFALYLQSLEDKLPEYSEAHKKQHFLTKIRPELCRAVISLEHVPETRDEIIEVAARIEENLKLDRSEKKKASSALNAAASGSSSGQQQKKPEQQSGYFW